MKKTIITVFMLLNISAAVSQSLAPTPPMGWMTWNFFGANINENVIKEMADAMVSGGMKEAGYEYIFIDDGWVGGRDKRNNIIPDPEKFPSGIKALADYIHSKGLKVGIYSDASPLTCEGYTASYGFEDQDAKTFASWGIDYLKYDYCHAPSDSATAFARYKRMADALKKCGRPITFGICEWGERRPWNWAAKAGGQLWRTTGDIRDKWKMLPTEKWGQGILNNFDETVIHGEASGPGHWNDPDMLIIGLYGHKGPTMEGGGTGLTDVEYQTQFSLWAMLSAPLAATNDIRNMNEATKNILLNKEVIAVDQDALGKSCTIIGNVDALGFEAYTKPLANGDVALAILNRKETPVAVNVVFEKIGLLGKYEVRDLWQHKAVAKGKQWKGNILPHETKLFRLSIIK